MCHSNSWGENLKSLYKLKRTAALCSTGLKSLTSYIPQPVLLLTVGFSQTYDFASLSILSDSESTPANIFNVSEVLLKYVKCHSLSVSRVFVTHLEDSDLSLPVLWLLWRFESFIVISKQIFVGPLRGGCILVQTCNMVFYYRLLCLVKENNQQALHFLLCWNRQYSLIQRKKQRDKRKWWLIAIMNSNQSSKKAEMSWPL